MKFKIFLIIFHLYLVNSQSSVFDIIEPSESNKIIYLLQNQTKKKTNSDSLKSTVRPGLIIRKTLW